MIYATLSGETKLLCEWSEILGVSYSTLHKRISYLGYTPERALSEAVRNREKANEIYSFDGKELTLCEWAKRIGIPYDTLSHRLFELNWSVERAFTEPKQLRKGR